MPKQEPLPDIAEDYPKWVLECVEDHLLYNTCIADLARKYGKARNTIYRYIFNNPVMQDFMRERTRNVINHIDTKMNTLVTESMKAYLDGLSSHDINVRVKVATEVLRGKAVLIDKQDVNHSGQIVIEREPDLDE